MFAKTKNIKIISLACALILMVGALAVWNVSGARAADVSIANPCNMVLYPRSDATQMAVTWWDAANATDGKIVYGTSQDLTTDVKTVDASACADNGFTVFEGVMTGLTPGTKYYYKTGHGNTWSSIKSFTASNPRNEFSFVFLGDVQYAEKSQAADEYAAWSALVSKAMTHNPDFALLAGDLVQERDSLDNWNLFVSSASDNFSQTPMLSATGNHETNPENGIPERLIKYLSLPANGPEGFDERFYSYDYGNMHITVLDSNVFSGEQKLTADDLAAIKNWILTDLKNSNATWKIVAMHHPAYSVVSDDISTQVMANWVDVFEEAQVDVVFCGHQHVYMRTLPLYQGKQNINGINYIMGNSGSKYYTESSRWYAAKMIADTSTYQMVNVTDSNLSVQTYDKDDNLLDSVTLTARDRTKPIESVETLTGDVNGDGKVDATDYNAVLDAIMDCAPMQTLDVNGDGKVDIADAHLIRITINAASSGN